MNDNPYSAPVAAPSHPMGEFSDSVAIRTKHLKHEASVKSIGTLYFLGGLILLLAIICIILIPSKEDSLLAYPIAFGLLVLACLQLWLGVSIRRLRSAARIPAIIFSVIGLAGFPLGTLISAYSLYLLCCQKGKLVFSPEYARIIQETPEIKYRSSILVWIILIILIVLFGVIIIRSNMSLS